MEGSPPCEMIKVDGYCVACQEPQNRAPMCLTRQESPRLGHQRISPYSPSPGIFCLDKSCNRYFPQEGHAINKQRAFWSGTVGSELPNTPAWSQLLGSSLPLCSRGPPVLLFIWPVSPPSPAQPPPPSSLCWNSPTLLPPQAQGQKHLSKLIAIFLLVCLCIVFKPFYFLTYFDLMKTCWAMQGWSYYPHFTHIKI